MDESRFYWCHKCQHVVLPTSPESNLTCPCCGDGFLEQAPSPSPSPSPRGNPSNPAQILDIFEAMAVAMRRRDPFPSHYPLVLEDPPGAFSPIRGGGGGGGIFVMRGGDMPPRWLFHGGDPELGSDGLGLERLIQQLIELEVGGGGGGHVGTPPATRQEIESLPTITIGREQLGADNDEFSSCAVCKEDFALGNRVRQMPCKHVYHQDCILPWLALHGSCPVCRYEMGRRATPAASSSTSGGGRSGSRFPWPFRRRQ